MRILLTLAVIVALVIGGTMTYGKFSAGPPESTFRAAAVTKGELLVTVTATGTVEPEEVVDVGAQVVGRIKELGKDPRGRTDPKFADKTVDWCSPVEEGMMLAQIDPAVYDAQFSQQDAAVQRAEADLLQMQAKLMQAEAESNRAEKLRSLKLTSFSPASFSPNASQSATPPPGMQIKGISDADYILAKANFEMAKANVELGKATVDQQKAMRKLAKTNLDYTTILSPVSGTILDRRVNIGQTVVSSMNAPSLFLIAKDLKRMQVWASVVEADIGRIKIGMPVNFTVDTFPDDTFKGEVSQVRLNAKMEQAVVTYTVVVDADNSDLKLLPYLTADVKFVVDRRDDVLMVPNSALRFRPKPEQIVGANEEIPASDTPEESGKNEPHSKKSKHRDTFGTVWVKQGELLRPIDVHVGISDGIQTQVSADELKEDVEVVTGEKRPEAVAAEVNNPLAPPRFRRRDLRR